MSTYDEAVEKQHKPEVYKRPSNIVDLGTGKQVESKDLTFDMARDIGEVIKAVKDAKSPALGYAFVVWTEAGAEARIQATAGHGSSFKHMVRDKLNNVLGW